MRGNGRVSDHLDPHQQSCFSSEYMYHCCWVPLRPSYSDSARIGTLDRGDSPALFERSQGVFLVHESHITRPLINQSSWDKVIRYDRDSILWSWAEHPQHHGSVVIFFCVRSWQEFSWGLISFPTASYKATLREKVDIFFWWNKASAQ
jgi:hypothetical protein